MDFFTLQNYWTLKGLLTRSTRENGSKVCRAYKDIWCYSNGRKSGRAKYQCLGDRLGNSKPKRAHHYRKAYRSKRHGGGSSTTGLNQTQTANLSWGNNYVLERLQCIEQVVDVLYLKCYISLYVYQRDVKEILVKYNTLNGILRRNFGKKLRKKYQIMFHTVISNPAHLHGCECWKVRQNDKKRATASQREFYTH